MYLTLLWVPWTRGVRDREHAYSFTFEAGPGTFLSFATMFVKSNDLFYAPSGEGIELFSGGVALSGDITSLISLYDAGTEVNEEPGTGPNQPLNGGGGVGTAENGTVRDIADVMDGFTYPAVSDNLLVSIENDGATGFTVTIANLAGSSTPIAPGVWVIHTAPNPLWEEGMADYGDGLEALAEDGDPSVLAAHLEMNSGYVSPLAPGAWAVHASGAAPLFMMGSPDYGRGSGKPGRRRRSHNPGYFTHRQIRSEIAAEPLIPLWVLQVRESLLPGNTYEFTFDAEEGDYLSFATMLVHSNDLFYSPSDMGIPLFTQWNVPSSGDITSNIMLYDAGTEVNELPGVGLHQPARLNGGDDENGQCSASLTMALPTLQSPSVVKITITPM